MCVWKLSKQLVELLRDDCLGLSEAGQVRYHQQVLHGGLVGRGRLHSSLLTAQYWCFSEYVYICMYVRMYLYACINRVE